jgi:peroxiredoxin Q/BCP
LDEARGLGHGLALVGCDAAGKTAAFAAKHGIGYPLLSDTGSEIVRAFGVLDCKRRSKNPSVKRPGCLVAPEQKSGSG